MTIETIETFLFAASKKLPDLIMPKQEETMLREVYDDHALFVFNLEEPISITDFQDIVDETFGLTMLYHHMRSRDTDFGHSFCSFQELGTGDMKSIHATTNGEGLITRVDVKLYESAERFRVELQEDLHRILSMSGEFGYKMREDELLSYFIA